MVSIVRIIFYFTIQYLSVTPEIKTGEITSIHRDTQTIIVEDNYFYRSEVRQDHRGWLSADFQEIRERRQFEYWKKQSDSLEFSWERDMGIGRSLNIYEPQMIDTLPYVYFLNSNVTIPDSINSDSLFKFYINTRNSKKIY